MCHNDIMYKCKSVGDLAENRAKIGAEFPRSQASTIRGRREGTQVPGGGQANLNAEGGSARAGSRGERDSRLLFAGLLDRLRHGRRLDPLDEAIRNALDRLRLPLDEVRYPMAINADARADQESMPHVTYSMIKNDRTLALCGETKADHEAQSWATTAQVFERCTNHHTKRSFESVSGCVTCLPGCFAMHRLFSVDCPSASATPPTMSGRCTTRTCTTRGRTICSQRCSRGTSPT